MTMLEGPTTSSPALLTFYCPFESEVSLEKNLLISRCTAWAKQFGLGGHGGAAEIYAITGASMVARFYPRARGELAQALADYGCGT